MTILILGFWTYQVIGMASNGIDIIISGLAAFGKRRVPNALLLRDYTKIFVQGKFQWEKKLPLKLENGIKSVHYFVVAKIRSFKDIKSTTTWSKTWYLPLTYLKAISSRLLNIWNTDLWSPKIPTLISFHQKWTINHYADWLCNCVIKAGTRNNIKLKWYVIVIHSS